MSEYNVNDYYHRPGDRLEVHRVPGWVHGSLELRRVPWWVRRWRALCRWVRP